MQTSKPPTTSPTISLTLAEAQKIIDTHLAADETSPIASLSELENPNHSRTNRMRYD